MNNRDEWLNRIMKDQSDSIRAIGQSQREAMAQQLKGYVGLHQAAEAMAQAVQAVAGVRGDYIENMYEHINSLNRHIIDSFKVPNMHRELSESISRLVMLSYENNKFHAVSAMATLAQSIVKNRVDYAAIVSTTLTNMDVGRIAGNSMFSAIAALQAEQAKGIESLRESFAGIVAGALRQSFNNLDERDEQAFTHFEELVDEKIATLPQNQVTADSLLQFLLMLFIALSDLGVNIYQAIDGQQSSKIQSEQYTQIMNVLGRIAINTQRLAPEQDQNIYYVVERKVDLKIKPKNSSATITTIFPNQKTRLVQMNHQWIYIEYFDYLEGIPKYGWANKKYLKRIE